MDSREKRDRPVDRDLLETMALADRRENVEMLASDDRDLQAHPVLLAGLAEMAARENMVLRAKVNRVTVDRPALLV